MSAQEADSAYIEPLDYEDSAEQEPYIDTIMDEVTEPPAAQPQQTPSVQPSTAVPPTAQSPTLAQESLTQAAQSKLTDVNLGGLSTCKIDPLKAGNWILWKTRIHKIFRLFEITDVVHSTEVKPEDPFLARRWLGKDGVAQAPIINNIDDQQMNHVVKQSPQPKCGRTYKQYMRLLDHWVLLQLSVVSLLCERKTTPILLIISIIFKKSNIRLLIWA